MAIDPNLAIIGGSAAGGLLASAGGTGLGNVKTAMGYLPRGNKWANNRLQRMVKQGNRAARRFERGIDRAPGMYGEFQGQDIQNKFQRGDLGYNKFQGPQMRNAFQQMQQGLTQQTPAMTTRP